MSDKKFKYHIDQNPYSDSIRTVTCSLGDRAVEKTFYGWFPFQFFWIERWIVKTEKMLKRLDELESKYE